MKRILHLSLLFFLFAIHANAQDFITTWNTGFSSNLISFEATTSGVVNYTWESTTSSASGSGSFQGPDVTISGLPSQTTITLSIEPENFKSFKFISSGFSGLYGMSQINQWGAVEWETFEDAFSNANISVLASDLPDLSNCTSLKNMFSGNFNLNTPFNINFWDISNVTDLSGMFLGCFFFNQALSQWDTSNVTDMSSMFESARFFNQNIGSWDTSNVTNMSKMFKDASEFDRNIGNWNTANVTDMSEMFFCGVNSSLLSNFNKNIGSWNTSNVTNMKGMFNGAIFFNQNIGGWDTSNVTDMSEMFKYAVTFNQNIGTWDTSSVTNMSEMFRREIIFAETSIPENSAFNNGGSSAIENWDTANVVDMTEMFSEANNFNHSLANWALNEDVVLVGMLDQAGLDCFNYTETLIGWNNNPATPDNKILGATFLEYGIDALPAINNLVFNKGWGFSGHDVLSTIPEFIIDTVYCENDTIPPLPTTSEEGINGTWSPAIDSAQTTTYTFTPNDGECAIETTITLSIEPSTEPTFAEIPAICEGETLAPLPTLSENGISGTWSPELNNTATTTYTFTPNDVECATTTTLTIGVNPLDETNTPTFNPIDDICFGEDIADLPTTSENGIVGTWSPALNNTATTTYTFTPNDGQCAGTATLTISVEPNETPTFSEIPDVCEGETLTALPTTSENGITGSWSPELNNTATTTYTFTPDDGLCAATTTLTITVEPNETPIFLDIADFCEGETPTALPTTSDNGITGTWSPELNNTATTTYTFTPDDGQCAATFTTTIAVTPVIIPKFDQVPNICAGEILFDLPTTSQNGITGTWSPELNNTATTTYTFTPDVGQCAEIVTMTITVITAEMPSGDTQQTVSSGSTIADISISPTSVLWYLTLEDAQNDTNLLSSGFLLEDNTMYFAVNTNGECRSEPFAVTIFISLSVEEVNYTAFTVYPNPVTNQLYMETTRTDIESIEIYNINGKRIFNKAYQKNQPIDVRNLSQGMYLIKVKTEKGSFTKKMIKK